MSLKAWRCSRCGVMHEVEKAECGDHMRCSMPGCGLPFRNRTVHVDGGLRARVTIDPEEEEEWNRAVHVHAVH